MGSPPCSPRARKNPGPVSRIERPYLSLYRRAYPMSEYAVSFQNQPVDVSEEFSKQESHFFLGSRVDEFDQRSATGKILWKSMALKQRVSYHQVDAAARGLQGVAGCPAGRIPRRPGPPLLHLFHHSNTWTLGMLASTRGMKLAVLDLVRLLAAKKSLEIIAATLAQIPVASQGIYLLVYKSIAGSRF